MQLLMLKIVGRDEYLTYENSYRIIDSLFVRHCIRNDEVDTFLEFALIFAWNSRRNFLNVHD